ncbi:hypothetical protein HG535_0G04340 [Zygotorulaspora mrakii]|uniref:Major facilitator superfamily (MFS) profile domain-containing protein n=1 Tax=Zygotorulaspora mrakii TaxID=42260 RepID=A0A7H9B770_ZYGMR|nr:uncharacterized protein HG535_0G04340 [Zygotorulaspora mrakii]QLG74551.1 hypothetical protein HG535_0G04340 [Zygotorulaspora mrakii]
MGKKDRQRKKLRQFIRKKKEQERLTKIRELDISHQDIETTDKVNDESNGEISREDIGTVNQESSKNSVDSALQNIVANTSQTSGSAHTQINVEDGCEAAVNESNYIKPIRKELLQDPESDLPGFVAGLIEEQEVEYLEAHRSSQNYGTINRKSTDQVQVQGVSQTKPFDEDTTSSQELQISGARINAIMLSMYLGIFLAAIDNTIISTISAHIASEFNELPKISLVATAYLLSSATFQPLYGKVSDIFGRKPLLIFTNVAFLCGCLICSLSNSLWWLVFGRFIAGIGGGGVTSMSSITITDIVPLRERALYQGICNFFFGLGTACGGIVGGWFSDSFGGWRMAFLVQVPLSAISVILIISFLQLPPKAEDIDSNDEGCSGIRSKLLAIDWLGATAMVMFLSLFLVTASLGGKEIPFESKMFPTMCFASVLSFAIFVYVELKVAIDPILPLSFLKDRNVLGSSLSNCFGMMSMMTTSYYLPIYFSGVLNMKPIDIGKRLAPNFFSVSFGSLGAGYYMKKTGKYYWFVVLFCVIAVLGQLQIYLIRPTIATWRQFILTMVPGFGASVMITVSLLAMIAAVPQQHQASTTSISYAFRSVGCTLGVAIGGAIFRESLNDYLNKQVMEFLSDKYPKEKLLRIIHSASSSSEWVHTSSPKNLRPTLINCYHLACKNTFLFCLLCAVATLMSISIIREKKLHATIDRSESTAEESTHLV